MLSRMLTRAIKHRHFFRNTRGTAAIEFAIVAPVLILLMMGIIAYGFYFGAMHSLQQIAADAARTSIAGLDELEREDLARRFVETHADGYPFIDRRKIAVEVQDSSAGEQFTISLRYDAENLPIWNLLDSLPLPGKTMHRTSTIRNGGI